MLENVGINQILGTTDLSPFIKLNLLPVLTIYSFVKEVGHRDHDRMVVGFITIYAISAYHCSGEVYSIQHYVKKFVSDLRQVGGYSGFLH